MTLEGIENITKAGFKTPTDKNEEDNMFRNEGFHLTAVSMGKTPNGSPIRDKYVWVKDGFDIGFERRPAGQGCRILLRTYMENATYE